MKDLPEELPLPAPMVADLSGGTVVPKEDLKPLYNFAVDCRECQARLTAAQADLKDEQTKTQAVGKERDSAPAGGQGWVDMAAGGAGGEVVCDRGGGWSGGGSGGSVKAGACTRMVVGQSWLPRSLRCVPQTARHFGRDDWRRRWRIHSLRKFWAAGAPPRASREYEEEK